MSDEPKAYTVEWKPGMVDTKGTVTHRPDMKQITGEDLRSAVITSTLYIQKLEWVLHLAQVRVGELETELEKTGRAAAQRVQKLDKETAELSWKLGTAEEAGARLCQRVEELEAEISGLRRTRKRAGARSKKQV